jgi:SAM-dependent methyltransferase
MEHYLESNRKLWNEWTRVHERSDFYNLEAFKAGKTKDRPFDAGPGLRVRAFEVEELGDVRGKSLLHLQCHFGIDTLSWARLGAKVTGIDFSPDAIAIASALGADLGIDATFIGSSVQDLRGNLEGEFDVVYTSRGAIWWLDDLDVWAQTIAHFLRPDGVFYITEFHPILMTLGEERDIRIAYPYFARPDPLSFPVQGSYADRDAKIESTTEYGWTHPISEIVTAIARAGLRIEFLHEFDWVDYEIFPMVEQSPDGKWRLQKDIEGELPLMFSLRAAKD